MKFVCKIAKIDRGSLCDFTVAPHAGAWVEILTCSGRMLPGLVAPHAGAWVEITVVYLDLSAQDVAPHAGAWVEISSGPSQFQGLPVAPHAGAWVEIVWRETGPSTRRRRPPTRGLCCTPKCGTLDKKKYQQ